MVLLMSSDNLEPVLLALFFSCADSQHDELLANSRSLSFLSDIETLKLPSVARANKKPPL